MAVRLSLSAIGALATLLTLPGCGLLGDDDTVPIAFIGTEGDLQQSGLRLSPAGQHIRAATAEGLVGLNENGEVVPGLAERWIVTDDGLSYIFRLRNANWPDGAPVTSENVRAALLRDMRRLEGTSLGLDLAIIDEMRAMTGRVIEFRLKSPMPQFLQLLAQPEFGLTREGDGMGPMAPTLSNEGLVLEVLPPAQRGLPDSEDWQDEYRRLRIASLSARAATDAFDAGEVDAVFNGRLSTMPYADTGPLSRGTVRLDGTFGLFGLLVTNGDGLLGDPSRRGALALAIDRDTIVQPFNIGGWTAMTRIVPPDLPDRADPPAERWTALTREQRQSEARRRISAWRSADRDGGDPRVTVALPAGPGSDILFRTLVGDFQSIGVRLERPQPGERADLLLIDRVARYAAPRWFLNQFNCSLRQGLCAPEADALVREAMVEADPVERERLMREAEQALVDANVFIPIGAPVRWSLVRGGVDGFAENIWGLHPLYPLAQRAN